MLNRYFVPACIVLFLFAGFTYAQKEQLRVSPKASVMQVVGFTEIKIDFSRPGVKGRTIWGDLVPYNKVWRAGANEATTINVESDVIIEGKKLPAGTYSLFAIPGMTEWTLIFNKVPEQWGAFEYNEAEDALRINIKPVNNSHTEWLTYSFTDLDPKSKKAVINLSWEKLKVSFTVEAK